MTIKRRRKKKRLTGFSVNIHEALCMYQPQWLTGLRASLENKKSPVWFSVMISKTLTNIFLMAQHLFRCSAIREYHFFNVFDVQCQSKVLCLPRVSACFQADPAYFIERFMVISFHGLSLAQGQFNGGNFKCCSGVRTGNLPITRPLP